MSLQVQASRSRLHSAPSMPSSICFKKRYVPQEVKEDEISSRRSALLFHEQAQTQKVEKAPQLESDDRQTKPTAQSNGFEVFFFTNAPRQSDDELDSLEYSVSQGDDSASTVSSHISSVTGRKKQKWDLRDFPAPVWNYRKPSWTIHVYDRDHRAGDTVWFRVAINGKAGYKEFEDTEIIDHIKETLEMDSQLTFYLKTKYGQRDFFSELFGGDHVLRALKTILRRARSRDGIVIPSFTTVVLKPALKQITKGNPHKKQEKRHEQQEQPCFLSWLLVGLSGASDKNSAFIGLS